MSSEQLFEFDNSFNKLIIGTDEAGRGPAAGGVFASAVYFPEVTENLIKDLSILNDSKKLSAKKRDSLFDIVKENSINKTICVEVEDIEKYNILNCSLRAMKLACEDVINQLKNENILVLVDGNKLIREFSYSQQFIIKGDGKSASIAAASILAKVSRDRYMLELDKEFPQYNWKQNAGYLTKQHLNTIDELGLTKYHRKSFLRKHYAKEKQLNLF